MASNWIDLFSIVWEMHIIYMHRFVRKGVPLKSTGVQSCSPMKGIKVALFWYTVPHFQTHHHYIMVLLALPPQEIPSYPMISPNVHGYKSQPPTGAWSKQKWMMDPSTAACCGPCTGSSRACQNSSQSLVSGWVP
jgi:hypothetical protein